MVDTFCPHAFGPNVVEPRALGPHVCASEIAQAMPRRSSNRQPIESCRGVSTSVVLALSPKRDSEIVLNARTAEECGRSAARGRLPASEKPSTDRHLAGLRDFRVWPNAGFYRAAAQARKIAVVEATIAFRRLTIRQGEAYIDPLGRAAAWRDDASAKPLTVYTVTSGHDFWPCWMRGWSSAPDAPGTEPQGSGMFDK